MTTETMHEMIETRINGNISDFNQWCKQLSQPELMDMMECARGYFGIKPHIIVQWIRAANK